MKQITFLLIAVAALAGVVAIAVPASLRADESGAPWRYAPLHYFLTRPEEATTVPEMVAGHEGAEDATAP